LPSFQIGTAPAPQSPDGLLLESVINLGLGIPTQTTDLITELGLPNPLALAEVGAVITNGLNNIVGPLTNGLAGIAEHLTAFVAQQDARRPTVQPVGHRGHSGRVRLPGPDGQHHETASATRDCA
jgi:hypothetical protein